MKARQILHDGGFYPEDVVRLDAAFAGAWEQLKDRFSLVPCGEDHRARQRLVMIIRCTGQGSTGRYLAPRAIAPPSPPNQCWRRSSLHKAGNPEQRNGGGADRGVLPAAVTCDCHALNYQSANRHIFKEISFASTSVLRCTRLPRGVARHCSGKNTPVGAPIPLLGVFALCRELRLRQASTFERGYSYGLQFGIFGQWTLAQCNNDRRQSLTGAIMVLATRQAKPILELLPGTGNAASSRTTSSG